jgi:hypothetical protein
MAKITITTAQALLKLIKSERDVVKRERFIELFLSGAINPVVKQELMAYLKSPLLRQYKISLAPAVINEDPSRRYFETHLAYETMRLGISQLTPSEKHHIKWQEQELFGVFNHYAKQEFHQRKIQRIHGLLNGVVAVDEIDNFNKEFGNIIKRFHSREIFPDWSNDNKEIILSILRSSYLAVSCARIARVSDEMPINIYGQGLYSEPNRGKWLKVKKLAKGKVRNPHFGLLKNWMPVPPSDTATSDTTPDNLKASDQASFDINALWPQINFSRLVHPFSNSISGTLLCYLRSISMLNNMTKAVHGQGHPLMSQSAHHIFENNIRQSISVLLFLTGGHSLFEYFYPLLLEPVQKEFSGIKGYGSMTLQSMFLTNNREAFDLALKSSLSYNDMVIARKSVNAQLVGIFSRADTRIQRKRPAKYLLDVSKGHCKSAKISKTDPLEEIDGNAIAISVKGMPKEAKSRKREKQQGKADSEKKISRHKRGKH